MARPLPFSRTYPGHHSKKKQPTFFVEKIWKSLWDAHPGSNNPLYPEWTVYDQEFPFIDGVDKNIHELTPKHHTIRAGKRWKKGDWFKPVVWGTDVNPKSGRSGPYHSKQIQFAPETQLVNVWDFDIDGYGRVIVAGKVLSGILESHYEFLDKIGQNDGLTRHDLLEWFKYPSNFSGQILCWNESVNY